MYKIDDLIVYGSKGVCRVEEIGYPDIPYINQKRLYYTLVPIYSEGRIYTPVDTSVFMRPVITCEEAQHLIVEMPTAQADSYDERNLRLLAGQYDKILQNCDCKELIQLIRRIHVKRETLKESGKKFGQIDEQYMKRAEEMLHGEFAVALGIPKSGVKEYIIKQMKKLKKNSSME